MPDILLKTQLVPPQFFASEEAQVGLLNFFLEQEEDWNLRPRVQSLPWTPYSFLYDEILEKVYANIQDLSTSGANVDIPGSTLTISLPSGTLATHVVMVVIDSKLSGTTCGDWTAPAGWTAIQVEYLNADATNSITIQYFVALGDVSNLTFTKSGSVDHVRWEAMNFSGVDNTNPVDAVSLPVGSLSQADTVTNSVDIITPGAWLVVACADYNDGLFGPLVSQINFIYDRTPRSPGLADPVDVTSSASSTDQIMGVMAFALRPVLSAPGVPVIEEDYQWPMAKENVSWNSSLFREDESGTILISFGLDQQEPWTASYQSLSWKAVVFVSDDPFVVTPTSMIDDEPPWIGLRQTTTWTPNAYTSDEISSGLKNFFLEQEEPWIGQRQSITWTARFFGDEEQWTAAVQVAIISNQVGMSGVYGAVVGGVTQTGGFRVQNNIEGYNVYVGVDVLPDFTQPPAVFSLTLPISIPVIPPVSGTKTLNVVVRKQDTYGLESQNQYLTAFIIDNTGGVAFDSLIPPQDFVLFQILSSSIRVLATYPGADTDTNPADLWKVWIGTTLPSTGSLPYATQAVNGDTVGFVLGPVAPGTYYVILGLYRTLDSSLSTVQGIVTVNGPPYEVVPVPSGYQGD